MRKMITVKINGEERQYPQGATYEDVANDYQQEYENLIALAARDGKIRELFKKLTRDCEVTFFTLKFLRIKSFMWASHIPHIMPSIFKVVFIISIPSFVFIMLHLIYTPYGYMSILFLLYHALRTFNAFRKISILASK